jgi:hypothetical protein
MPIDNRPSRTLSRLAALSADYVRLGNLTNVSLLNGRHWCEIAAWKETCVPIPHSIAEGNIFPSLGSVSDSDRVI